MLSGECGAERDYVALFSDVLVCHVSQYKCLICYSAARIKGRRSKSKIKQECSSLYTLQGKYKHMTHSYCCAWNSCMLCAIFSSCV